MLDQATGRTKLNKALKSAMATLLYELRAADNESSEVSDFLAKSNEESKTLLGSDAAPGAFEWGFQARDASGELVGVIQGDSSWGILSIDRLVVATEQRRSGVGGHLLRLALQFGRTRGLNFAMLQTFDYQAPAYYPRFGFRVDFARSDGIRAPAGRFLYFSRTISPFDPDVTAFDIPEEDGPDQAFIATGSRSILRIHAATGEHRRQGYAFAREQFKAQALGMQGATVILRLYRAPPFSCNCLQLLLATGLAAVASVTLLLQSQLLLRMSQESQRRGSLESSRVGITGTVLCLKWVDAHAGYAEVPLHYMLRVST